MLCFYILFVFIILFLLLLNSGCISYCLSEFLCIVCNDLFAEMKL